MWNFISWFEAPEMKGFPASFLGHFPHVATHYHMMRALPSMQSYLKSKAQ